MPEPLVLLHGFTQTGRSWAGVSAALGERYRAFAPDLPGHGDAAHRRPATIDACVTYIRAAAPERFVLCGYSMGGRIALHAALAHPERLDALVLVSASPGIADAAERERRRREDLALADRIEAVGIEQFAAEWGAQPLFEGQPRGVSDIAHTERLRQTPGGLAAALRGMGTGVMQPAWDRLASLEVPVTLVVGERDEKFRAIAAQMAERLPTARQVVIQGAGHAAHLEVPSEIAEVLRKPY